MDYVKGIFKARPNRFIAEVEVNGNLEIAHVPNTGRCKELLVPGATVYLSVAQNPERRTKYDLAKTEEREHIVKGLVIALANIDRVIEIIRGSADKNTACEGLMNEFVLSEKQANAILEMKLRRLTSLEVENLEKELAEIAKTPKVYGYFGESVMGTVTETTKEASFAEQAFIKDDSKKVAELVKGGNTAINKFAFFVMGEGLEKKSEDLSEEVAKQVAAMKN